MIRLLGDVGTPAIGAAIVGLLLRAKTMSGTVRPIVITAAAGPADVTGSERGPHRHLGHVHQQGGAGRPLDDIEEMGTLEIAGKIIGDDDFFFSFQHNGVCMCVPVRQYVRISEQCGPYHTGIEREAIALDLSFTSSLHGSCPSRNAVGPGPHGMDS